MLTGMERHRNACHCTDFTRPHTTCVDHIIRFNRPLIRQDATDTAITLVNISDLDTLNDADPVIAGPLGKRLRDIDGISLAILWQPYATNGILDIQMWITVNDLRRADFINLDPKSAGHGR